MYTLGLKIFKDVSTNSTFSLMIDMAEALPLYSELKTNCAIQNKTKEIT